MHIAVSTEVDGIAPPGGPAHSSDKALLWEVALEDRQVLDFAIQASGSIVWRGGIAPSAPTW